MASMTQRLTRLAQSPQAQRALTQARAAAAKPENKAKVERLRARLAGKRVAR